MQRGEVWLINLDPAVGAEIKKTRPAVIVPITEWHVTRRKSNVCQRTGETKTVQQAERNAKAELSLRTP